ncbi:hypothetical protein MXD63_37890, partial [Frankia sp. Cpl3]|nr:hypothetical protein [Frankia sp. Cpl3]
YFSVQLLEMGLPSILALNMMDVAASRGLHIDLDRLEQKLGVPVVPTVARRGEGQQRLLARLTKEGAERSSLQIPYPANVEAAIVEVSGVLEQANLKLAPSYRWTAAMWLEQNETVDQMLRSHMNEEHLKQLEQIRALLGNVVDHQIRNARYAWIETLLRETTSRQKVLTTTWSDRVDSLILHRIWGIPIFFA